MHRSPHADREAAPASSREASATSRRRRLFLGIWPPASVVEGLIPAQEELQRRAPRGLLRLTPRDQIHLTLRFLGDVEAVAVTELVRALHQAAEGHPAFALVTSGIGAFPTEDRARVVWAGVTGELTALAALHLATSAACDAFAGKPEDKAFHAHLTLARVREAGGPQRRQLAEAIRGAALPPSAPWTVDRIRLMASELQPAGSRYETIAEIPLATTR
jgi:2'-5' RNA ligase